MNLKSLPTEQRNQATLGIDEASTIEMLQMINNEDRKVPEAIAQHLPEIAAAVDALSEVFAKGGRIVYCGAGTSGRLGVIDASECPPTYGVSPDRVVGIMAGGDSAIRSAVEGAEDSEELCVEDLKKIGFTKNDALIGIAASGRTPYAIGGLKYANGLGAVTSCITCNPDGEMNKIAKYPIGIYAGPEAVTGSTRMKAGSVQKMVLNMLSTGIMVKNGKVYSNLMVNVMITNIKLQDRAQRIIAEITGAEEAAIVSALKETQNNVSLTIFMLLTGLEKAKAEELLQQHNGHIKNALKALQ